MAEGGVGPAELLGDLRVTLGEPLHVGLVDDRVGPAHVGDAVGRPSGSKRTSSTQSACSVKREKLVPSPSQVAPSGVWRPGQAALKPRARGWLTSPLNISDAEAILSSAECGTGARS